MANIVKENKPILNCDLLIPRQRILKVLGHICAEFHEELNILIKSAKKTIKFTKILFGYFP